MVTLLLFGLYCASFFASAHEVAPAVKERLEMTLRQIDSEFAAIETCESSINDAISKAKLTDAEKGPLVRCLLRRGKQYASALTKFTKELEVEHIREWTAENCHVIVPIMMKLLEKGFPLHGTIIDIGGPGPTVTQQPEDSYLAAANHHARAWHFLLNAYTCYHHLDLFELANKLDLAYVRFMSFPTSREIDWSRSQHEHVVTPFLDLQEVLSTNLNRMGREQYEEKVNSDDYIHLSREAQEAILEELHRYSKRSIVQISREEQAKIIAYNRLWNSLHEYLIRVEGLTSYIDHIAVNRPRHDEL